MVLGLLPLCLFAQNNKIGESSTRCEVGLLYQISYQPNWGDSRAVVVEVSEASPAAKAGIRMGDIIEAIDGKATKDLSEEEINALLLDPTKGMVDIVVSNFGYTSKHVALQKKCRPAQALSEELLARSFAMYSLEDVTQRRFTMPFAYSVPDQVDYRRYKTFSMQNGQHVRGIEKSIKEELQRKGLTYEPKGGDLLVRVQANIVENPDYREGAQSDMEMGLKNYRVNVQTGDIEKYPFLSINAPSFTGTHKLVASVELWDASGNKLVWSVKANERLNGDYPVDKYMSNFAPLMLSNFPFVRYVMNPSFVIHKNNYRYLGIYYDATDLQRVLWIDKGSPADRAGLRAGDRILTINGLPLNSSVERMTDAYMEFIKKSLKLRDEESVFPSTDGFKQNKYWRLDRYPNVMSLIQDPKYLSSFSYLFSHRGYIHTPIIEKIILEVDRGKGVETVFVTPILLHRDYLSLY